LFEVLGGVSPLQIGNAFWEGFLLAVLFVDGLGVFFFEEDADAFGIVHS